MADEDVDARERRVDVGCALVALVGVALRLRGASPTFYSQEALQAFVLGEPGGFTRFLRMPAAIRPFGFSSLADLIGQASRTEAALRSVALVPSLLSVGVAWWVLRVAGLPTNVRRLGLFLFAAHPVLISHAQELKPYSLDVLATLTLVGAALAVVRGRREGWPVLLVSLPLFAFVSHATAFVGPPATLVVVVHQWRSARVVRSLATWLAGLLGGSVLAWQYLLQHEAVRRKEFHNWGDRFGVPDAGAQVAHTFELLRTWPAAASAWLPDGAQLAVGVVFASGVIAGAVALARHRRVAELALTGGALACVAIASALAVWPWGAVRVNTFLVVPLWLLLLYGVTLLQRARAFPAGALVVALLALPLPLSAYPSTWQRMDVYPALAVEAARLRARPEAGRLYIAHNAQWIARFYARQHERARDEFGADLLALESQDRVRWIPFQGDRLARWLRSALAVDPRATAVFTMWDDDAREGVLALREDGVDVVIEPFPGGFTARLRSAEAEPGGRP